MSYQVIARKYRPQKFADVVGQEHVTQTLINAIQQNRIAHAYLFVGPRGTGKTTIARIFAKCLNCTGGPKVDFPDDDPRCVEISEGRSLDVLEIDGASNRGIEEIRALRETVKYAPAVARFKIYIIDEVHMLTKEAFNALLKTLEEPPAHVKFMFATTEPEKVLPTILSRCQRYDLRRIPIALIVQHLGHIAELEKVAVEENALYALARGAEGCMRDAESTLDQLISFCGNRIVETDVLAMFGLAARAQIQALAGALLAGDLALALRALDELIRNGKDLSRLLSDLLSHFRNLALLQVSRNDVAMLEMGEAEAAVLRSQTQIVGPEVVFRIMETLADGENRLRETFSKRILVEITFSKAIQARNAVSIEVVLQQLNQLRSAAPSRPSNTVQEAPSIKEAYSPSAALPARPPQVSNPVPSPAISAPAVSANPPVTVAPAIAATSSLDAIWAGLLESLGRSSLMRRSHLAAARPVSMVNNVLTIGFPPEARDALGLVDEPKGRTLIQNALNELGLGNLSFKLVKITAQTGEAAATAPLPVTPPTPPPPTRPRREPPPSKSATEKPVPDPAKPVPVVLNKEDFKNDPLIKQALEIFKGQIVEVRGPAN